MPQNPAPSTLFVTRLIAGDGIGLSPSEGTGIVTLSVAGSGSSVATVTLNGATPVTVADTAITANSIVIFTLKTVGGTVGAYPSIKTITAGTGFTVEGTSGDTSVYNYLVIG